MSTGETRQPTRFLVVEDETLIAMLLETMLEEIGHQVTARATTLDEASALAESGNFDAAILDVHVAGEEIYPVVHQLERRSIPFIFCSGHGANIAEDYRDRPILAKPYRREDLEEVLTSALRANAA